MGNRLNTIKRKNELYSKEDFFNFFTSMDRPEGITINFDEEEKVIRFCYQDEIYALLIKGENWEEIKAELERQRLRKQEEDNRTKEQEQLDSLTKLYNKEYSRYLIEEYLENEGAHSNHALMIVDIDNFDTINEHLGYMFGDTVLINIADSLRKIFRHTDIAGRIGGDAFLIFLKDVSDVELLKAKAKEIYSVFMNTYTGENKEYKLSCSIGISMYSADGHKFEDLFEHADTALRKAKEKKEQIIFYNCIDHKPTFSEKGCFEAYYIQETTGYGSNSFDKEITAFAFDIMVRTKDVKSAINLLLNQVRRQFNCSRVCIVEKSVMEATYSMTYLSNHTEIKNPNPSDYPLSIEEFMKDEYFDDNGIGCIYDSSKLQNKKIKTILKDLNIGAVLCCAVAEDGNIKALVSMDTEGKRDWTESEKDSLVTITKIISSYLLKMRASDRANKQLYNIRNYDGLTGIPTLHKLQKDIEILFANKDKNEKYAVVYSDISQFKHINDSLGYERGDRILCDFADLIKSREEHICYARISDDNFLIVLHYGEEEKLKSYVVRLFELFNYNERIRYPGYRFIVSSGVSHIESADDLTTAIDNANIARKSLKTLTKTECKFFDISMKEQLKKEIDITNTMESALKNGEFIVYMQPKVGLKTNKIVGGEALVRWKRAGNVIVPPNDFIPLFERNGFIVHLDFYVYEEVFKILQKWMKEGKEVVPVSLNVSRIHLYDENFVKEFKELVDKYEIPYSLLELELTESIFLSHSESAFGIIKDFRKLGFSVSIDDFGSGYSALNLLKNMETDVLKLDKEFFGNGEMKKEEKIIVSNIINMAKQLNMKVLSEGIETENQSNFLKSVACDMAQGFLFSRPMPMEDFEKLLDVK